MYKCSCFVSLECSELHDDEYWCRMRVLGVLALLLLTLTGCVATPGGSSITGVMSYDQVLAQTKLVPDPHTGWTSIQGPIVFQSDQLSRKLYMIQTQFDRRKPDLDEKFVILAAGLFPKRVYLGDVFSEGRKLKSKVLDRERRDCGYGCTTVEKVGISLTEAEMEDYARRGMTFEVTGRRDTMVVTIPPSYFAAVLEFHRQHRGAPP